jgi:DNA-binding NarL/FixJ family response regulator
MPEKIKVFHLEDYKIIRDGIRFLLGNDEAIEVVGEARQGEELLSVIDKMRIDILLLDIYLDGMQDVRTIDGFEV